MRRRHRWDYDENQPDDQYAMARRRVNRLKRFYKHVMIYVIVNVFIIAININDLAPGESYFKKENFFTAFFWGIGLACHGISVFSESIFFGKNWEERKIQELMKKEENNKWE
ncbi:MAG: 2TM domain-containing protein [Bacteroidota bacterium]